MPETLGALEKYLANGSIKGIGEATAKNNKKFGEDTINVFKFEPEKLAQIKGISKAKANRNVRMLFRKLGSMANSWIPRKIWNRCRKC